MRFGYTRVSTVAQTLHQQHDALKAAGASKIYSETMSGARDDRPGLGALMDQLRGGDTVVVWKLDTLGRSLQHILATVKAPAPSSGGVGRSMTPSTSPLRSG
jgi:DNA invertase Pin-like site-specific DNA recombinase